MRSLPLNALLLALPLWGVSDVARAQSATATPSVAASSNESPERRRKDFVERSRIQIRSAVTANQREVTEEERVLISEYWRRSMRIFRIRELAETGSDGEAVARAEKLLERFGKRFYEDLRQLNLRAPTKSGRAATIPRPVSVSSGAGAQ